MSGQVGGLGLPNPLSLLGSRSGSASMLGMATGGTSSLASYGGMAAGFVGGIGAAIYNLIASIIKARMDAARTARKMRQFHDKAITTITGEMWDIGVNRDTFNAAQAPAEAPAQAPAQAQAQAAAEGANTVEPEQPRRGTNV